MHDVPGEVRVLHAFDAVELSGSAPRLTAGRIDAPRQVRRGDFDRREIYRAVGLGPSLDLLLEQAGAAALIGRGE